jgi:hypothetical protein
MPTARARRDPRLSFLWNSSERKLDILWSSPEIQQRSSPTRIAIREGGVVESVVDHHVSKWNIAHSTGALSVLAKPVAHASPNGLELTGDGGAAAGVRCSDVLGAGVVGLVAMGLLPPYARDGGSSRCQGVHRASGAGGGALMLRNP